MLLRQLWVNFNQLCRQGDSAGLYSFLRTTVCDMRYVLERVQTVSPFIKNLITARKPWEKVASIMATLLALSSGLAPPSLLEAAPLKPIPLAENVFVNERVTPAALTENASFTFPFLLPTASDADERRLDRSYFSVVSSSVVSPDKFFQSSLPSEFSRDSQQKEAFVTDYNETYLKYRHWIWGVLIAVLGQSVVIGLLWYGLRQRALNEKHLSIFHTALEQCPVAAVVVNSDFQVEFVNRQYCQESRLSFSQAVGKSLFGLQGFPFSRNECISRLSGERSEALWQVEALCHGHDGSLRHHRFMMSATRKSDGTVTHYVVLRENIDAQKRAEAQLVFQANYDALTELPNRALLTTKIRQAIEQADRVQSRFAVLFLDLDGFKQINDYFGHTLGDQFLVQIAERIADTVGRAGFVARMGGDEFVVLMPLSQGDSAQILAQTLIERIQAPLFVADKQAHLSVSIGVALYPDDGDLPDALLQHADLAMYTSKSEARAGFRFYEAQMGQAVQRRALLEVSLHQAIAKDQLRLVYQPVVDLKGRVVSCEALVRWRSDHGEISPDEFIPLAERTGFIHQLGEWVLREAAQQFQKWSLAGVAPGHMAINVSFNQFHRASILALVERCLADFPAVRNHLTLEITERVLIEDLNPVLETLNALKALGCRLAIDDFGTGYSSLSYLAQYPFDIVKIDRRFLQDLGEDGVAMRLLRGITTLAQALSLRTVVEGVEDQPMWQMLAPLGIDAYQGYCISKAVGAEAFEQFMYRCLNEGPNFVLGAYVEEETEQDDDLVTAQSKKVIQEDALS